MSINIIPYSDSDDTSSYSTVVEECAICLEPLDQTKCCTTDCGHTFHSKCIFTNFKTSFDCPLCRTELVEKDDEDEDEDETSEADDGTYEDDDYSDEVTITSCDTAREEADAANPEKLHIKQIHEAIKKKGYTEYDFISFLLLENFPTEIKQTKELFPPLYCDDERNRKNMRQRGCGGLPR